MSSNAPVPPALMPSLLPSLAANWWLFLLRGIVAIIFGVLAFVWPGITILTFVMFFGAFVLVDGIVALAAAVTGGTSIVPRWWLAIVGILGIAAGVMTFVWPGITALILLTFMAAWSIAIGVCQIVGAIRLRKEIDNEWLLVLSGALSVLFGLALFVMPGASAVALAWMVSAYAIVFGVLTIAFAFRIRRRDTSSA